MFFKSKKRDQPQSGISQKQNVKGGININLETKDHNDTFDVERLIKALDKIDKRFDNMENRLHNIEHKTDKTNLALNVYVAGNGVSQKVKDMVNTILEE